MSARFKLTGLLVAGVLCLPIAGRADTQTPHRVHKVKKQLPPPLPSGPQGPVPQIPLDAIPAVAPEVTYQDGLLTIVAPNSTGPGSQHPTRARRRCGCCRCRRRSRHRRYSRPRHGRGRAARCSPRRPARRKDSAANVAGNAAAPIADAATTGGTTRHLYPGHAVSRPPTAPATTAAAALRPTIASACAQQS